MELELKQVAVVEVITASGKQKTAVHLYRNFWDAFRFAEGEVRKWPEPPPIRLEEHGLEFDGTGSVGKRIRLYEGKVE